LEKKDATILVVVVLVLGGVLMGLKHISPSGLSPKRNGTIQDFNCVTKIEERIVRGNSLFPTIKSGETVKILSGYYNCHEVDEGDIVIYHYSGDTNPLIKIVKGIPGDKLGLKKSGDKKVIGIF